MQFSRRKMLKLLAVFASSVPLGRVLAKISQMLEEEDRLMPVLFVGHGSPTNVLEDNAFTRSLRQLGRRLPVPKAIACVSAHWLTRGTWVQVSAKPKQIYDFYGFSEELYGVRYEPEGAPELAKQVCEKSGGRFRPTTDWGIDHGTWTVLYHLFPEGNIPVFQISIDYHKPLEYHAEVAGVLAFLRRKGVLIIGSGNITHNIRRVWWDNPEGVAEQWAQEFDQQVKEVLDRGAYDLLYRPEKISRAWHLAHPEPSHWLPLIYAAFLHERQREPLSYAYEGFQYGTLSMRCVVFGEL